VRRVSAGGYLHSFAKTGKTELSLCTYVLGPHRFEFRGNRWTSTRFADERRQKSKHERYFCLHCSWLQAHAIGGQEDGNEGLHRFGAEAISLLWRLATLRCPQEGQDLFVETRKRKVSKCRPNKDQPTNLSTPQTNQPVKTKNFVGPGGSKESTKAQSS
jgi:hypothetical protein